MEMQTIKDLYDSGCRAFVATMDHGQKKKFRMFENNGILCYFKKGSSRYGYQFSAWVAGGIVSVKPVGGKKTQSVFERYMNNLRKFKKAYTQKAHPNLWSDIRKGYTELNVDDFAAFAHGKGLGDTQDTYQLYKCLGEYCEINDIRNLVMENHYKTTTIKSHVDHYSSQYRNCVENIKRHLDNKEEFKYYWRSSYDVSVSGRLCDDGVYRAWFSLEFRGCGNGHYYLLIDENTAVFCEDD